MNRTPGWDIYIVTSDCFLCDCCDRQHYYDSTAMALYDYWGKIDKLLCRDCYNYVDSDHCGNCQSSDEESEPSDEDNPPPLQSHSL